MTAVAPVLVILDNDLDAPQAALHKGVRLARRRNAPLQLFLNCYNSAMAYAIGLDRERMERATKSVMRSWEKRLRQLLDRVDAGDTEIHLIWESSDFPFLANLILSISPQLIVVPVEQVSGLRRMLMTPRQWRLVRKAPAPVLCVGDRPWPEDDMEVVAAVDVDQADDALTDAIVREASGLAEMLEARLVLAHVVEFPDEATLTFSESELVMTLPDPQEVIAQKREALHALAHRHGLPPENTCVLEGNPAQALTRHLEAHPGILVMGTVYRGAVRRLLLGSTAERVLRQSEHDLLVVKPDDFETPWRNG